MTVRGWSGTPASPHVDFATYLGGSGNDTSVAVAVDIAGNTYVTGSTNSPDFPLTSTAFGVPSPSQACAFVTKLNAGGSGLVWSVCMAGLTAQAVAVDAAGEVYLLASTGSGVTLICKVDAAGSRILWQLPLGAPALMIAVDPGGDVYAAGSASSGVPTTAGAYQPQQPQLGPGNCKGINFYYTCPIAFVMKVSAQGTVLAATYLGGYGPDDAHAIAVDGQGNVWLTGQTVSPNFPVTANAFEPAFHGEIDLGPLRYGDAFVSELDPTLSHLLYSTYLGGSSVDQGWAITTDSAGAVYVTGGTQSPDFPTTPNVLQPTYTGSTNSPPGSGGVGFAVKFRGSGSVVYATFLNGGGNEVAVDSGGDLYAGGNAPVLVLSADAGALLAASPGVGPFALDNQRTVHVAQNTGGFLSFPTPGVFQPAFGGGASDAWIFEIDFSQAASPWVTNLVNAANFNNGTNPYFSTYDVAPGEIVTVFGTGFDARTQILFNGVAAPILYTSPTQINAVVPFELDWQTAAITVKNATQTIGPATMNVLAAVPALFTLDGSGSGQAAALNQDGSVNSAANPAARGSVIQLFLTGAGALTPSPADGSITPLAPPFATLVQAASAIYGQVVYAGAAPGLVAGVVQINLLISNTAPTGSGVNLGLRIGGFPVLDATVAVR
ncbi:MAG: SBBP repeat-containing protein [Bryobacteraceae bacterium]